jgi:uncharacterized protein with GYD domain
MPTYVTLAHWTERGITNYKDFTTRAEDVSKLVESLGGRLRELLCTLGEYDVVAIIDFPDDETATTAALRVGAAGNVRTNTLRAFTIEEMGAIVSKAG